MELLEDGWTAGLRTLALNQPAIATDKDGKFSFSAVLPGTYFLRANPPQAIVQQQLRDSDKETLPERQHVTYIGTIYPSAQYLESAVPMTLFAGVDQHGVRIEMQKSKYYTFSGHVDGIPSDVRTAGLIFIRLVSFDAPFPFIATGPLWGSDQCSD